MNEDGLVLHVASFSEYVDALRCWENLKDEVDSRRLPNVDSAVVSKDSEGVLRIEQAAAEAIEVPASIDTDAAMVAGLFAPPLLLSAAVHAGVESHLTDVIRKHAESRMGADVERYLAPRSSAIVLVVRSQDVARIDGILSLADSTTESAIDPHDYDAIREAISAVTAEEPSRSVSHSEAT